VFGVTVYDSGVQPVWVSIENKDHVPYAFFASSVDQNRFSDDAASTVDVVRAKPDRSTCFLSISFGRIRTEVAARKK
jgi:hypothetical protein